MRQGGAARAGALVRFRPWPACCWWRMTHRSPSPSWPPSGARAMRWRGRPPGKTGWRGDVELELSAKEFDLLALLAADAGRAVTRDRIMREVWDEHWYGPTKTLDMHISWLRKKLGDDPAAPRLITTLRGVGFRFETG